MCPIEYSSKSLLFATQKDGGRDEWINLAREFFPASLFHCNRRMLGNINYEHNEPSSSRIFIGGYSYLISDRFEPITLYGSTDGALRSL